MTVSIVVSGRQGSCRHAQVQQSQKQPKKQHVQQQKPFSQLQVQHKALQREHEQLRDQHTQLQLQSEQLQAQHNELQVEHAQCKAQNTQLQAQHNGLQQEHPQLQAEHDAACAQADALRKQVAQLEAQQKLLQDQNAQLLAGQGGARVLTLCALAHAVAMQGQMLDTAHDLGQLHKQLQPMGTAPGSMHVGAAACGGGSSSSGGAGSGAAQETDDDKSGGSEAAGAEQQLQQQGAQDVGPEDGEALCQRLLQEVAADETAVMQQLQRVLRAQGVGAHIMQAGPEMDGQDGVPTQQVSGDGAESAQEAGQEAGIEQTDLSHIMALASSVEARQPAVFELLACNTAAVRGAALGF